MTKVIHCGDPERPELSKEDLEYASQQTQERVIIHREPQHIDKHGSSWPVHPLILVLGAIIIAIIAWLLFG